MKFGRMLAAARGERKQSKVAAQIHRASLALSGFSRSQLARYEKGEVNSPDPVVLFYLARLYRADLADWIAILAHEREAVAEAHESPPPGPKTAKVRSARPA